MTLLQTFDIGTSLFLIYLLVALIIDLIGTSLLLIYLLEALIIDLILL